jgi:hypothetical protein
MSQGSACNVINLAFLVGLIAGGVIGWRYYGWLGAAGGAVGGFLLALLGMALLGRILTRGDDKAE